MDKFFEYAIEGILIISFSFVMIKLAFFAKDMYKDVK